MKIDSGTFDIRSYIRTTCCQFEPNILLTIIVVDVDDDDDFERSLVFVHILKRQRFLSQISTNAAAILV